MNFKMSVAFLNTNNEPSGKEIKKTVSGNSLVVMVKNPPSTAGDSGSIPPPTPPRKIPHASEQLSP